MASIGSLSVFAITGDLIPQSNKSTMFGQNGADGAGFIIGPKRPVPSELISTSFSTDRTTQDALKKSAAALCGTVGSITRDIGGSPVVVADCFIKDFKILKSDSGAGMPSSGTFVTVIAWEIYTPVDWV